MPEMGLKVFQIGSLSCQIGSILYFWTKVCRQKPSFQEDFNDRGCCTAISAIIALIKVGRLTLVQWLTMSGNQIIENHLNGISIALV